MNNSLSVIQSVKARSGHVSLEICLSFSVSPEIVFCLSCCVICCALMELLLVRNVERFGKIKDLKGKSKVRVDF